jgi:heme-degrading monooxygenase HmoA
MFSAALIWEPGTYDGEFNALNALFEGVATSTSGLLGAEGWKSEDGKRRNATHFWKDLESLQALAANPKHIEAKKKYAQWSNGYHVVISDVVKSPGDSAFTHATPSE